MRASGDLAGRRSTRSERSSGPAVRRFVLPSILALGLMGLGGPALQLGLEQDASGVSRSFADRALVDHARVDHGQVERVAGLESTPPRSSEGANGLPRFGVMPGFEMLEVAAAEDSSRPFGLPFGEPPGPGSWYVSQPYGNTVYAFFERMGLYKSGQGLHMGLDFAAPCGTPVLAIGDGVVLSVDGRGGAPPHNLMIDHSNGFVSFYGHLLERPSLNVGQYVRRGQAVALSGDMYSTCVASPHLHLELRDPGLNKVYNPVNLIDADWHGILLFGSAPLAFERDMDAPRRWQTIEDQPPIQLGGPLLNDFESPWPGDGR